MCVYVCVYMCVYVNVYIFIIAVCLLKDGIISQYSLTTH